MKLFILFLTIIGLKVQLIKLNSNIPAETAWLGYKSFYGLRFSEFEDQQRFSIFKENYFQVDGNNYVSSLSYKINEFSHLTNGEYARTKLGSSATLDDPFIDNKNNILNYNSINETDEFDWIKTGYVTPVKNQFSCGSSYAYAAISAFETAMAIKTQELRVFSARKLTQCLTKNLCGSRKVFEAFDFMEKNGLNEENTDIYYQFPYIYLGSCQENATFKLSNYRRGPTDEEQLKKIIFSIGPVVAIIDASQWSFRFYSSGIYNDSNCNIKNLNHELMIVGYGVENGQDYWLCKNSWGTSWGLNGYIKIARGKNTCGIATNTYYLNV